MDTFLIWNKLKGFSILHVFYTVDEQKEELDNNQNPVTLDSLLETITRFQSCRHSGYMLYSHWERESSSFRYALLRITCQIWPTWQLLIAICVSLEAVASHATLAIICAWSGSSSFPRDPSRAAVILCVKLEAIAPHAIPKWAAVIMRVAKAVASHAIPKWAA